ncbi:glutathione S-transferase [Citrobacter koseri]|uniref:Glutathione S-transferase n=1 Tax=Citrobacter koseri TaxID=545 RepID=A0A078LHQ5_CITKO|nr:glutathione S-transferase [Citrobacter koseri]
MIKVYGVPGWGSAISEVMLTLAEIPYQFIDVKGFDAEGPQRDLLQKLNPLCQIPTLALENGEIMTESAAIALMILDRRPDLAPPVGHAERQRAQRFRPASLARYSAASASAIVCSAVLPFSEQAIP